LYLFGCITALFGCLIRQTSLPSKSTVTLSQSITNQIHIFWLQRKSLFFIIIISGFAYANYSIALILMNGMVPLITSLTKTDIMEINTYLLILDCCALPFFGWLASKIRREKLMLSVSLGVVFLATPLLLLLEGASLMTVMIVRIIFVILGVAFFSPFDAWAQQLIPDNCRYAVISLGYALGSQILGSPTATIALWCFQKTGMISSIGWYWMALAFASSLSIILLERHPFNNNYSFLMGNKAFGKAPNKRIGASDP
jgi:MFS family permease